MALSDTIGLLFKIRGDGDQAVSEIKKVTKEEKEMEAATGGLNASFAKMAGPAGAAVAGITAIAGVAAAGAAAIYGLAKASSEYASTIADIQGKTGASAALIQTLGFYAEQTGSNIEAVSGHLAKFNVLIGQSNDGNDKAAATLKKYGVTATDTTDALKQAVKVISEMTTADEKAVAAKELFRDKSGEVIAIVESMGGSVNDATAELEKLGIVMSQDAVNAGDEFGDQLDLLNKQLSGMVNTIGADLIPILLDLAKEFSKFLSENRTEIKGWGQYIADTMRRAVLNTKSYYDAVLLVAEAIKEISKPAWERNFDRVRQIAEEMEKLQIMRENVGQPGKMSGPIIESGEVVTPGGQLAEPGRPVFKKFDAEAEAERKAAAEKRAKEREAAAKRDLETQSQYIDLQIKAIRQGFQDEQAAAEKAYSDRSITEDQFIERSNKALAKYAEDTRQYLNRAFEIDSKGKNADEIQNLALAKTQAIAAIGRDITREQTDRAKLIEDTNKKSDAERKKDLEHWNKAREAQKDVQKTENEIIDAAAEDRQKQIDHWNERRKADQEIYQMQADADAAKAERDAKAEEDRRRRVIETTVGSGGEISAIGQLQDHFAGQGNSAALIGIDAMSQAFAGLGQALGQVVSAWVLYGKAGQSVRQVTAQILAGIAQQAAVKAVFELAEGFAALALAFFGLPNAGPSAGAHFTAAAIYGGIAGVAAIAGRAVAGNSFANQASNATGASGMQMQDGASRNATSGAYSGEKDSTVIEGGINTPWNRPATIVIKDKTGMMGKLLEWEIDTNSRVRSLIVETASA